MLHSGRFTVLLDACVLYPAPLRDLLLTFAAHRFYTPKWSERIQREWSQNLMAKRGDLTKKQLEHTTTQMALAFPDALVTGFKSIEKGLSLPDKDDNHVLAAALKCKADVIVTSNLKDFPKRYVGQFDIEVQSPDDFMCNLIDLDQRKAKEAFRSMVNRLRNPPQKPIEVLGTLNDCGMKETAGELYNLIFPIQPK